MREGKFCAHRVGEGQEPGLQKLWGLELPTVRRENRNRQQEATSPAGQRLAGYCRWRGNSKIT